MKRSYITIEDYPTIEFYCEQIKPKFYTYLTFAARCKLCKKVIVKACHSVSDAIFGTQQEGHTCSPT